MEVTTRLKQGLLAKGDVQVFVANVGSGVFTTMTVIKSAAENAASNKKSWNPFSKTPSWIPFFQQAIDNLHGFWAFGFDEMVEEINRSNDTIVDQFCSSYVDYISENYGRDAHNHKVSIKLNCEPGSGEYEAFLHYFFIQVAKLVKIDPMSYFENMQHRYFIQEQAFLMAMHFLCGKTLKKTSKQKVQVSQMYNFRDMHGSKPQPKSSKSPPMQEPSVSSVPSMTSNLKSQIDTPAPSYAKHPTLPKEKSYTGPISPMPPVAPSIGVAPSVTRVFYDTNSYKTRNSHQPSIKIESEVTDMTDSSVVKDYSSY